MNLVAILNKLDPENSAHWTSEGLPRLDVLDSLGAKGIKRNEVQRAAPHFSRANPKLELVEPAVIEDVVQDEVHVSSFTMESSEFGGDESKDHGDPPPAVVSGMVNPAVAKAEAADALKRLHQLDLDQAELDRKKAEAKWDHDQAMLKIGGPADSAENQRRIMAYLASTVGGANPGKAQIDKAFEAKRGYGTGRPNRQPRTA